MRNVMTTIGLTTLLLGAGLPVAGDPSDPETDADRTLYAIGLALGRQVESLRLSEAEYAHLAAGLRAAATGKVPAVSLEEYGPRVAGFTVERRRAFVAHNREVGRAFLERIESEGDVRRCPSGGLIRDLQEGSGASGADAERVRLRYFGSRIDGSVFESSDALGGASEVELSRAVPCWHEAVATMRVGGASRVYCPPETAYGDTPYGSVAPGSTVVFELELLAILE